MNTVMIGLLALAAVCGWVAYAKDIEATELEGSKAGVGAKFGCPHDRPIPGLVTSLEGTIIPCIREGLKSEIEPCWIGDEKCGPIDVHPEFLEAVRQIEEKYDRARNVWYWSMIASLFFVYLVAGWYAHWVVLTIASKFVAKKWALLMTLMISLVSLNAVGFIRAVVGLIRLDHFTLPPPETGRAKGPPSA